MKEEEFVGKGRDIKQLKAEEASSWKKILNLWQVRKSNYRRQQQKKGSIVKSHKKQTRDSKKQTKLYELE